MASEQPAETALPTHGWGFRQGQDRCRGHTVVACSRGGVVYAVVSRLPEEHLLVLMRGEQSVRGTVP